MEADHKWPREALKFDEQWHESKMKALVPSLPTGSYKTCTCFITSYKNVNPVCIVYIYNPGYICSTLIPVSMNYTNSNLLYLFNIYTNWILLKQTRLINKLILEIISMLLRRIGIPPPTAPPGESLCIKTGNQIGGWVFPRFDHVIRGGLKYTNFYSRQHSYSMYMLWQFRLSVCPSVCPSVCHRGGSVKNGWS